MKDDRNRYGVNVEATIWGVNRQTGPYLNDFVRCLKGSLGDINQSLSEEIDWEESRQFEASMLGDKCIVTGRVCSTYRKGVAEVTRDLVSRFMVDLWKLILFPSGNLAQIDLECVVETYEVEARDSYSDGYDDEDEDEDENRHLGGFSID